ncbi:MULTISPECIES: stalk domain-containing protein [Paenibacillus]|uniref:stalk domain-containing protein n=1 Tax=Paenibacillus TaxID=44249 RepID=UPI002FE20252
MNRKSLTKILLSAVIAASGLWGIQPSRTEAAPAVQILLDGYPLNASAEPTVINGTTLVPFRSISEALGIPVTWNAKARTITAVKNDTNGEVRVQLTLNRKQATVNGTTVQLAEAPRSAGGNTLIPLSFFSQQFGAKVEWNQASRTVSVTSPKEKMYTLGFYAIRAFSDAPKIASLDAVSFGWSRIDENGKFTRTGRDFNWPQAAGDVTSESLVTDASAAGTTPYLMVYSSDAKGELTKVIENAEFRKQAISDMIAAATEHPFQGIMLDFEGLGLTTEKKSTQAAFTAFVKEVRTQTKAAGLKLGLALHPLNSSYQGYDYKALGELSDEIVIMAYNYGAKKQPDPAAKVDEAIRLALQETDKSKLVLGLNLDNENEKSIPTLIGLAKRYDLKGIALWRLGIISAAEWSGLDQTIELKP